MQRLALLSDTHWNRWNPNDTQAAQLLETLGTGFDSIWHGGDFVAVEVMEALEEFAPVTAVKGNCDSFFGRHLPHSVVETVEDVKIAMIHGWDLPLEHTPTVVKRFPDDVKVIIHGHTHRRRQEDFTRSDGTKVTIINPGSVSSPRGGETPGMAELVVDGSSWEYRILPFH